MKSLTVYQPWASLIAQGEKKIETRGWYTKYRGPLAIHAGAARKAEYMDLAWEEPFYSALLPQRKPHPSDPTLKCIYYPWMSIIAICNLVDCIPITPEFTAGLSDRELAFGDYSPGRFAWRLEDVRQLKTPIEAKGHQKIWNFKYEPYQISIDPWVIGDTQIWTSQGIRKGKQVPPGKEDAVMGLEVA